MSSREIVTVLKSDGSAWYHVEYFTSNGNKRAYLQTQQTRVPGLTYSYYMPIRSYTRSNDYRPTASPPHYGIDIASPNGTPVYAMTSGTATFKARYDAISGQPIYMSSYGNYVELQFGSAGNVAYYAHLSSFGHGYTAKTYPNAPDPRGWSGDTTTEVIGSKAVAANILLGYSGNTGNSFGPHLHFEIRESGSTVVDPFEYILFAKMPS